MCVYDTNLHAASPDLGISSKKGHEIKWETGVVPEGTIAVTFGGKQYELVNNRKKSVVIGDTDTADLKIDDFGRTIQLIFSADFVSAKMKKGFSWTMRLPYGEPTVVDREAGVLVCCGRPKEAMPAGKTVKFDMPMAAAPELVSEDSSRSPRRAFAKTKDGTGFEMPVPSGGDPGFFRAASLDLGTGSKKGPVGGMVKSDTFKAPEPVPASEDSGRSSRIVFAGKRKGTGVEKTPSAGGVPRFSHGLDLGGSKKEPAIKWDAGVAPEGTITVGFRGKLFELTNNSKESVVIGDSDAADLRIARFGGTIQLSLSPDYAIAIMKNGFSRTMRLSYGEPAVVDREAGITVCCGRPKGMKFTDKTVKFDMSKAVELTPVSESNFLCSRLPRIAPATKKEVISIEKPPSAGGKPSFNWLQILVTPAITIVLLVTLVMLLGMSMYMLAMMLVSSVMSAVVAIVNYRKQKKSFIQKNTTILSKYNEYLEGVKYRLAQAQEMQMRQLMQDNPEPSECMKITSTRFGKIWSRSISDEDFLHVRLGTGVTTANLSAVYKRSEVVIEETELEQAAFQVAQNSTYLVNAPILCDLYKNKKTGMIGERVAERELVRNMIISMTTVHSYDELKIVLLVSEKELSQWVWVRWLPHFMDDERRARYIFTSLDDASETLDAINDILARRVEDDDGFGRDTEVSIPHYLVISTISGILEKHPVRKQLFSDSENGCSVLLVYDKLRDLPKSCNQIIEIMSDGGNFYLRSDSANITAFKPDFFTIQAADSFARAMAPLYTDMETGAGSIPSSVTFLQGYGISRPEQLNIQKRWATAKPWKSLSVPVAATAGGDIFEFDIHEKRHGVNGIVAGMPGSGKTEMVQSWLLSLAANFSPQDLSMVLIDFKGTGLIAPFKKLPHVAGTLSNLDKNIDRNLTAIKSEVHRRETLIDKYSSVGVKNINTLNEAYASNLVPEKLPVLIIAIDEFAEFRKIYPEFGKEIDSLTSKGRALGMFVVLMTQKPAGVVSAKSEDNIKFRWCLRVANFAASKEMLGKPDAAKIHQSGRAYVKVGEDEVFEQVQAFWSGAPYDPENKDDTEAVVPISFVSLNGKRNICEHVDTKASTVTTTNEIDAVVAYIAEYCAANRIPEAEKIWVEQLPEHIELPALIRGGFDGNTWNASATNSPVFALLDDPENQRQYPLAMNFAECGHTIVYGAPVTGKTTLLQTLAVSLAMTTRPDETSIYILDFGGWNMNVLKDLPHVGGIAFDDQPERINKLRLLLSDELQRRKTLISQEGVGNIAAYRQIHGAQPLPDIVLLVDNFGSMIKMYPDLDTFFISFTSSGASYGMYMVATASATNAVPMKISQNIKNAIALQMLEKSDYTFTVGKTSMSLPAVLGRGLVKGSPPLEFQTALPCAGETDKQISENIQMLAKQMSHSWNGKLPDEIPEMPEVVTYRTLPGNEIMLGLSTQKVQPVSHTLDQHYLMISGVDADERTNLLQAAARQVYDKFGGKLVVFDVGCRGMKALRPLTDTYLTEAAKIDEFIESIRPELQRRHTAKQGDGTELFTPLIFAIDDYGAFFKAVSNDTISRLLAYVKIGTGLSLYLVVAGDSYELTSLYNKGEAVTSAMIKGRSVAILGGTMNDHAAVQTKAPYAAKSVAVNDDEGFLVSGKGEYVRFKAMRCGGGQV